MRGFEPLTCGLRNRCSATELHRLSATNLMLFCHQAARFANILQSSLCKPTLHYPSRFSVGGRQHVAVGVYCGLDAGMHPPGSYNVIRHSGGKSQADMGVVKLQLPGCARASSASKASYSDTLRCVFRLSKTTRVHRPPGKPRTPASASNGRSPPWCAAPLLSQIAS